MINWLLLLGGVVVVLVCFSWWYTVNRAIYGCLLLKRKYFDLILSWFLNVDILDAKASIGGSTGTDHQRRHEQHEQPRQRQASNMHTNPINANLARQGLKKKVAQFLHPMNDSGKQITSNFGGHRGLVQYFIPAAAATTTTVDRFTSSRTHPAGVFYLRCRRWPYRPLAARWTHG